LERSVREEGAIGAGEESRARAVAAGAADAKFAQFRKARRSRPGEGGKPRLNMPAASRLDLPDSGIEVSFLSEPDHSAEPNYAVFRNRGLRLSGLSDCSMSVAPGGTPA
jgi:hypothetical protein